MRASQINRDMRGWGVFPKEGRLFVSQVMPDGTATALRIGDEAVSLNGQAVPTYNRFNEFFQKLRTSETYAVAVRRPGQQKS